MIERVLATVFSGRFIWCVATAFVFVYITCFTDRELPKGVELIIGVVVGFLFRSQTPPTLEALQLERRQGQGTRKDNVMKQFVAENLKEGYILHVRHLNRGFGMLIQRTLKSWGSHDGLVVRKNGVLGVGDTVPVRAKVRSFKEYVAWMNEGCVEVKVFAPLGYRQEDGLQASAWWIQNEEGNIYNFLAYPLLLIKAITGDTFQWECDLKWNWCTEGCMDAWLSAGRDYWRKAGDNTLVIRPTPLTTEHRLKEGIFIDVTGSCVVDT